MGDIGGGEASGAAVAAPPLPASDNPDPSSSSSISPENWAVAQEIIQQVVNGVHPTLDSEEKRNDVIDYVQRLLKTSLGMEVFAYGSVPLKTYLPDGDIDLTILSPYPEGSWAAGVLSVLQREEMDENAEYEVRDTQFIDAEVKLVKCLVQNIVIDISFNQFGGLCTLCFLEQVDRLVGEDHLFKRGIIFIKAWCYYESRILGAHHGLLSTYALETLVLYIFHLFHSSLDGPLAVLYKFLDYFSKFDWDNYCISLNGPVCKSSLPEIIVDMPQPEGNQLLLSEEFLRNCMETFSIPSNGQETNPRMFTPKHMNIIDSLRDYNNLGRSVHRGNFYRIRSAFRYGARKLGRILSLPKDKIADEIRSFFSNTLQRCERNWIQDYDFLICGEVSRTILSSSDAAVCTDDHMFLRSSSATFNYDGFFMGEKYTSVQSEMYSGRVASSQTLSDPSYSVNDTPVSGYRLKGDDCDLATHCYFDYSPSSNLSVSSFGQYYHVPQLYLPKSNVKNGPFNQVDASDDLEEKPGVDSWLEQRESNIDMGDMSQSCSDSLDGFCSCSSDVSSLQTNISENLLLSLKERDLGSLVDTEPLNPLADLSGDYDSHIRSLLHGPFFHKLTLSPPVRPNLPLPISHVQNLEPCHTVYQSMPPNWSTFSQVNASTTFVGQPASSLGPSISGFFPEEKPKVRGTGTYLPIMNNSGRDGLSQGWDWATGTHGQSQKQLSGNGCDPVFSEANTWVKGGRERSQAWSPVKVHKKSGSFSQSQSSKGCDTRANGYAESLERIEFGSIGCLVDELMSAPSCTSCALASNSQMSAPSHLERPEQRVGDQPFGLENEEDFPPLSI